jgi:two-component system response regulator HydG
VQQRLLAALAQRSARAAGDEQVRVIATCAMDLEAMVREGSFRAELFELLAPAILRLPPLRQRSEDIPLLVRHFLALQVEKLSTAAREPSHAALALLRSATWPGNVAQLRTLVERASIIAGSPDLQVDVLLELGLAEPTRQQGDAEQGDALAHLTWQQAIDRARDHMAPCYLRTLLANEQGNVVAAAARAGIERESFYRLLRRYGVRADEFRGRGG